MMTSFTSISFRNNHLNEKYGKNNRFRWKENEKILCQITLRVENSHRQTERRMKFDYSRTRHGT